MDIYFSQDEAALDFPCYVSNLKMSKTELNPNYLEREKNIVIS